VFFKFAFLLSLLLQLCAEQDGCAPYSLLFLAPHLMVLALRGVMSPAVGCDYPHLPGLPDSAGFKNEEGKKQKDGKTGQKDFYLFF